MKKTLLTLILGCVLVGCAVPSDYYERISHAVKESIELRKKGGSPSTKAIENIGPFRTDSTLYNAAHNLIEQLAAEGDVKNLQEWSEWKNYEIAQRQFAKEYDLIQVDW